MRVVIYVDQPIGTGFSYGNSTVNSTIGAAPYVWQAFQVLFESQLFSQYQSRKYVVPPTAKESPSHAGSDSFWRRRVMEDTTPRSS